MDRRTFLATLSAATALPGLLSARSLEYTPGVVNEALGNGETLFLDFHATWCGTCAAQGRVIEALRAENPTYDQAITFVNIDWDTYKNHTIRTSLNVPRRSTLIVLKGDKELGRLVAQTGKAEIKGLMDTALAAAMS